MFSLILEGALLVMVLGIVAKVVLDKMEHELRIDWVEFGIASAVLLLLVVPLTAWVGTKMAISSQVTFEENWGGFEVRVVKETIDCYRDGPMKHSYRGDREERVTYTDEPVYDSKGRQTGTRRVKHVEVIYHDIPYTNHEYTYKVVTTLGTFTIADRNLPENPNSDRYRWLVAVPDFPGEVGTPPFWTAAQQRIASGDPGPVTARRDYANYILASHRSILLRYSPSVDTYKKDGLLPAFNTKVHDFYSEDRVYFVGVQPPGDWQSAINRFNGAFGIELQGDLHLVIVDANKVQDGDDYTMAVVAYWLSTKDFDHNALSKNGLVVVLGTADGGQTVKWARASTGMPEGNESLLVDIQNQLKGAKLDPQSILGRPKATVVGDGVTVNHPDPKGVLEQAVWGPNKFTRVHMGKPGQAGNVGYSYLLREVEPTGWQRFWVIFVTFIFGCIAWGICIYHGAPAYRNRFGSSSY
jgi:hypothetical protein